MTQARIHVHHINRHGRRGKVGTFAKLVHIFCFLENYLVFFLINVGWKGRNWKLCRGKKSKITIIGWNRRKWGFRIKINVFRLPFYIINISLYNGLGGLTIWVSSCCFFEVLSILVIIFLFFYKKTSWVIKLLNPNFKTIIVAQ